ncbi:MAG TPA: ribosome biogenesis GTPase YlqF [Spongiibacteraceae bacterium]|nr:ribosome biogenesis GTPase YlqF [Spongiibacteraceae bacterium]
MSINWFPGHMHKAILEIKKTLPTIDVIIEVLDARIPYSSENPVIGKLRSEKPCIKLLSKSDLADPEVTQAWIEYFEREQGVKALAVTTQQPERIRAVADLCKKLAPPSNNNVGAINALIMGIPNVGKSTIINTLAGKVIAKTGNEPAITKGQQIINLHNGIMLVDTPGILWPKIENENSGLRLAVSGAIKNTAMSYDEVAFFAVDFFLKAYPELLKQRFKLTELPATELEFLEIVGRQRGCLSEGNVVNIHKISRILLTEFRDGILGRISLETPEVAEQEKILVQELIDKKAAVLAEKKKQRKNDFKMR